jgi:protein-disulfide isomerase
MLMLTTFILTSFVSKALAADSGVPDTRGGATVLEVDGVKITRAEFERKYPSKLFQAKNAYYEAERKAVEEYINEYLLEREAKREGLTIAQLLDKHVTSKLPPDPSDDALRVYFEGLDTKEPYEAVRDKIVNHLRERRVNKLKAAYLKEIRDRSQVAIRVTPPRTQVPLEGTPMRGPKNAPITFVEYADYECPYCQQIQPTLDRIAKEYQGKIVFAYKDVPLPNHPNAARAAEASHCAGNQGKYWEFHDILVTSKQLAVPALKQTARDLKLDTAAFDKCLDSGEKAPLIQAQLNEAQMLGLQGTPSFFINGRFFSGLLSYEQLKEIIEEELKAASETQRAGTR